MKHSPKSRFISNELVNISNKHLPQTAYHKTSSREDETLTRILQHEIAPGRNNSYSPVCAKLVAETTATVPSAPSLWQKQQLQSRLHQACGRNNRYSPVRAKLVAETTATVPSAPSVNSRFSMHEPQCDGFC